MTNRPRYRTFPDDYLATPDRAERAVLEYWRKADVFGEQQRRRAGSPERFVFYEGPPTANGRPGIHHVFARAIKDAVCRHRWMRGDRVERKAGWDTHGLPVELEVEKKLGISGKRQIEELGVGKFIELCRESVFTYVKDWRELSERIGYWLDYDHPYVTFEPRYVESVWYLLSRFAANGLLEKRFKVIPYCPRCGTGLSSHEVGQGYRDVQDPSVTVRFRVKGEACASLLVWTTTPWTLPSNVAVAVHPNLEYVKARSPKHPGEIFWVAKSRLEAVLPGADVLETRAGKDLAGIRYEAPFAVLDPETETSPLDVGIVPQAQEKGKRGAIHAVHVAEFVTAEEGTGLVHIAPFYGADDYDLCLRRGITLLRCVSSDGKLSDTIGGVSKGTFFKDADAGLLADLKARGLVFDRATIQHSYPFCWRCDTPLLYFAAPAWFLKTTAYRDTMVEQNGRTRWVPPEIGSGRFGEWLQGNVDWALSRDRYWGTPLPVWVCTACEEREVVDSIATLRTRVDESRIAPGDGALPQLSSDFDPHRPGIDLVKLRCRCGSLMNRDPSVVDCWFDSGAMPFAQHAWPFSQESRARVEDQFPADFIAEGLDQTRGWFYTLHAIATFLSCVDRGRTLDGCDLPLPPGSAYRACVVNGLVLDADGRKMSKRLGNAVDPFKAVEQHGADAVRLLLLGSGALHVNRRFDPEAITAIRRQVVLPLVNCLQFFATYANESDGAMGPGVGAPRLLDRWVLSRARSVAREVDRRMEAFDLPGAIGLLGEFADAELSNWYVRRNRERFRHDPDGDRAHGLATLREALSIAARCLAPFAPFAAEMLWHRLHPVGTECESVHLQRSPSLDPNASPPGDQELERAMGFLLLAARLARALREKAKLRTTIPLASLRVLFPRIDAKVRVQLAEIRGLLADEVNVDDVQFVSEAGGVAVLKAKPNFPVLGKKVGKAMKSVQARIEALGAAEVDALRQGRSIEIEVDGNAIAIGPGDVRVLAEPLPGLVVESSGDVTVALDTTIDPQRLSRARAREFKRAVNQARRDGGFGLSDLCVIEVLTGRGTGALLEAVAPNRREWLAELRASDLRTAEARGDRTWTECELLDGEIVAFALARS